MKKSKALIYLIVTAMLWSLGGLFIKLIDWHPIAISGTRSGIAVIVMFIYYRKPIKKISNPQFFGALSYAALVFLFVSANKLTTSANAILLQFTSTIWIALFSKWFLKKAVTRLDWLIIMIIIMGMCLFFMGDLEYGNALGNLLAILSGVAMASMIIFFNLQTTEKPIETTIIGNCFVFILALPVIVHISIDLKSIIGILVLGIFQLGISYIFFTKAIRFVSPLEAILIPIIEPILNPVWVLIFTGEKIDLYSILGGIVILSTVVIRGILTSKSSNQTKNQKMVS
ncbi:MAG: DMT family transporter [Clostridiales bacterium]|nr:DMT family transporter [Clostridiales bacterium]